MSQSKSLKADKELMWKKLSTLPTPPMEVWDTVAGFKRGEVIAIMAKSGVGKSMYVVTSTDE